MGETMENRVTHPNSQRPHLKYHLKLKEKKKRMLGLVVWDIISSYGVI